MALEARGNTAAGITALFHRASSSVVYNIRTKGKNNYTYFTDMNGYDLIFFNNVKTKI
jgi:hypothetical protein